MDFVYGVNLKTIVLNFVVERYYVHVQMAE